MSTNKIDGTLVALTVGLALWFLCATMVITTFVHPAVQEQPRVEKVDPPRAPPSVAPVARLDE